MKPAPLLSELVDYRNRLDALELSSIVARWHHQLAKIVHVTTQDPQIRFKKPNSRIESSHLDLCNSLEGFMDSISNLRKTVCDLIEQQHALHLEQSTNFFNQQMQYESVEYILGRRLNINVEDRERLTAKILSYSDWRVPGMVIRPGAESWIDHLVALDPLYVIDQHQELLNPSLDRFPLEYRRRMRPYVVNDRTDNEILYQLPNEQFGYIFAYNFFNFRPMELIHRYLTELWHKLRPGGTLLFTFNDCDWPHNVALAESSFMCYTPGSLLIPYVQQQGYEIMDHYHGHADCAWLEIRRPGKMRSMRGAQTLAKIMPRSK